MMQCSTEFLECCEQQQVADGCFPEQNLDIQLQSDEPGECVGVWGGGGGGGGLVFQKGREQNMKRSVF